MPTTPRRDTDTDTDSYIHLHALARQRAHKLRREAMDHAWDVLAGLLRRAFPHRA